MQLPIIVPALLVAAHAEIFRNLFENHCQFRHFENYLTGLLVLPNKGMANIVRCTVESSDKTNLSRYFSTDRWEQEQINDRRVKYMSIGAMVCKSATISLMGFSGQAIVLEDFNFTRKSPTSLTHFGEGIEDQ